MLRRLAVLAVLASLVAVWPARAAAPTVDADAYIVVEPATEEVLAQRAPDRGLPMASTTKIMTALIALESADLDDVMTVPPEAAIGGSSGRLETGERLTRPRPPHRAARGQRQRRGDHAGRGRRRLPGGVRRADEPPRARARPHADALREPPRPRRGRPPLQRPRPRGAVPRGDEEPGLPRDGVAAARDDPGAQRGRDPRVRLGEPAARDRPRRQRRQDRDDRRRGLRARGPRAPRPRGAGAVRRP